jgi:hypothetical protein
VGAIDELRHDLAQLQQRLRAVGAALDGVPTALPASDTVTILRLRREQVGLLRASTGVARSLVDQYDLMGDDLRMAHAAEQVEHLRALTSRAAAALTAARREVRGGRFRFRLWRRRTVNHGLGSTSTMQVDR